MENHNDTQMYDELASTAREYTTRLMLLTSQATTSNINREVSIAFNWINSGLNFIKNTAGNQDVLELIREQQQMTEECNDLMVQDVRNALQIAELTKGEMLHWQRRWTNVLIGSAFAPYLQH